jgi:hypothetical protein
VQKKLEKLSAGKIWSYVKITIDIHCALKAVGKIPRDILR